MRQISVRDVVVSVMIGVTVLVAIPGVHAEDWKPVPGHIMTRWAKDVNPATPLPEYPRPQLQREQWQNLNGLWDYVVVTNAGSGSTTGAVTKLQQSSIPDGWQGKILVPFPLESALSGVKQPLQPGQQLWYRRVFAAPGLAGGRRLLLHFGAVDWEAAVFVNGRSVGTHRGGFDAFTLDITDAVKPGGTNTLAVAVRDDTAVTQVKGKQKLGAGARNRSITYTPVSGIWQTVWLEDVPETHIVALKVTPDVGASTVSVECSTSAEATADKRVAGGGRDVAVNVSVLDAGQPVAKGTGKAGEPIRIRIADPKLWSPDSPHLYDLVVTAGEDKVASYFGMRSVSVGTDDKGFLRPLINGKFVFQCGLLDQGYWPDGLYTAPTDEALRYDLEMTRKLGFNMARKHIKVEPDRWYYWADKLGLLVWQDMPNTRAITGIQRDQQTGRWRDGERLSVEFNTQFETELKAMIAKLGNHPSVIVWVLFNEGWGQYDTVRLTALIKKLDASRLVNSACGGHDMQCGDFTDIHKYAGPACPPKESGRVSALGEFGGIGLGTPGHTWTSAAWGYRGVGDRAALTATFVDLWTKTWLLKDAEGLSAAVYTQTTDVEAECNGVLTYDREVVKVDLEPATNAVLGRITLPATKAP